MNRIHQALDRYLHASEKRNKPNARLGDANGNLFVTDENGNLRQDFVWARVQLPSGATVIQVRCRKSMPAYGSEVHVGLGLDDVWEVKEENPAVGREYWGDAGTGNVGKHASNHSRMGADPLRLESLQYMPLLTRPLDTPSLNVYVEAYTYPHGIGQAFDGDAIDLTAYVPAGADEQRFVIVGLDVADNVLTAYPSAITTFTYSSGTIRTVPYSRADVAELLVQEDFIPSAAVRLYGGMTRIELFDIFEDCRNWFEVPARKHNYNATAAPTVNDDRTEGYNRGSLWFVNGTAAFANFDPTPGAADWRPFGSTQGSTSGNEFDSVFIQGTDYQYSFQSGGIVFARYSDVAEAGVEIAIDRGRGTLADPEDVLTGDYIESLRFRAFGGGALREAGILRSELIDPFPNATSMGAKFTFLVTGIGGTSPMPAFNWTAERVAMDLPLRLRNLTTAERDALTPEAGWTIHNTDTDTPQEYDGSAWLDLTGGSMTVEDDDTTVTNVNTIQFPGATVTDEGGGVASVVITVASAPDKIFRWRNLS